MNGSTVNDKLIKGGQSITLKNGDLITFGQESHPFMFQYAPEAEAAALPPAVVDDRISLVPKAQPTYARIDHLATPQVLLHPKTATSAAGGVRFSEGIQKTIACTTPRTHCCRKAGTNSIPKKHQTSHWNSHGHGIFSSASRRTCSGPCMLVFRIKLFLFRNVKKFVKTNVFSEKTRRSIQSQIRNSQNSKMSSTNYPMRMPNWKEKIRSYGSSCSKWRKNSSKQKRLRTN